MVSTFLPAILATGSRHDFTKTPSTKTEQVPHSPAPHPSLVPVMLRSSRRKSSTRWDGLACLATRRPFTVASTVRSAISNLLCYVTGTRVGACLLDGLRETSCQKSGRDQLSILLPGSRLNEPIAAQHHVAQQIRADRLAVQALFDRGHPLCHRANAADGQPHVLKLAARWIHLHHSRQTHHRDHQRPAMSHFFKGAAVAIERIAFDAEQNFVVLGGGQSRALNEFVQRHC